MPQVVKLKYVRAFLQALANHPGSTDKQIADRLNEPAKTPRVASIPADDFVRILPGAFFDALRAASLATAPEAQRRVALVIREQLQTGTVDLSVGSEGCMAVQAMLAANTLTQAHVDALVAKATVQDLGATWGETLGFGHIEPEFVGQVREYVGMAEGEVKEQLAALLLLPSIRMAKQVQPAGTVDDYLASGEFGRIAAIILSYTELVDATGVARELWPLVEVA